MSVLQNILTSVSVINGKLQYVKTTSTDYIFDLIGYKLPKTIIDKNMNMALKERTPVILLDINQQSIGMYDYTFENFGNGIRFYLPKQNFPYSIDETDVLQVTGTFIK